MIDLRLSLQREAFHCNVSLELQERVTGIFGPSGSGKSTLLAMIAGIVKPDTGHIAVDGEYLWEGNRGLFLPLHQRRVGLMFQDSRLFPHLSVKSNLKYGYQGLKAEQRRFSFDDIVALLELGDLLQRQPHQLSGGQKQRVALGRTLLASPRLLLFDEPLAALDGRLKSQILPFLKRVRDEINIPMLYVSHAIDEILHLTSSIVVMEQGQVLGHGEFHNVMRDEKVLRLASSLGSENVLHGELISTKAVSDHSIMRLGKQMLYIPYCNSEAGSKVTISVAASNVAIAKQRLEGLTIQNQVQGVIRTIQPIDRRMLIEVGVGENILMAEVSAKAVIDLALQVGDSVVCLIKSQSIKLYAQN